MWLQAWPTSVDAATVSRIVREQGLMQDWEGLPAGDTALRKCMEAALHVAVQQELDPQAALAPCHELLDAGMSSEVQEILRHL